MRNVTTGIIKEGHSNAARNYKLMETIISKKGIPIRLTDERWAHITDEHCELAGLRLEVLNAVENPSKIFEGGLGEIIAIHEICIKCSFILKIQK